MEEEIMNDSPIGIDEESAQNALEQHAEGASESAQDGQTETQEEGLQDVSAREELAAQSKSMAKISGEIREIHKLYHNEFAGRLKTMQEELDRYHEIDRGRAFDDILKEVAGIYCSNEALLGAETDEKVKKRIQYLFMDLEQLLESNGVKLQKSKPGDKRNNKFCQIVNRIETDDPAKHDTVACSRGTGFYTEKRPLVKELIDVYIYQAADDADAGAAEERS